MHALKKLGTQAIAGLAVPLMLLASSPAQATPPGLVSHWTGDGTTVDSQGNNVQTGGTAAYGTGRFGNAFSFNGSGGLTFSTNGMPLQGNDRSMTFWVRPSVTGSSEAFYTGYGPPGTQLGVYNTGSGGGGTGGMFVSSWGPAMFGPQLALGNWSHVAVTTVAGMTRLYINGNLVNTNAMAMNTQPGSFYMGWLDPSRTLNGLLDDVAVFDRGLTQGEIAFIMQNGVGAPEPGAAFLLLGLAGMVLWRRRQSLTVTA